MTSKDRSHEQLEQLNRKAAEMTAWLHKLQGRLEANRFPPDDELLLRTREAFDRVQHLRMTLHYLACDAGRK